MRVWSYTPKNRSTARASFVLLLFFSFILFIFILQSSYLNQTKYKGFKSVTLLVEVVLTAQCKRAFWWLGTIYLQTYLKALCCVWQNTGDPRQRREIKERRRDLIWGNLGWQQSVEAFGNNFAPSRQRASQTASVALVYSRRCRCGTRHSMHILLWPAQLPSHFIKRRRNQWGVFFTLKWPVCGVRMSKFLVLLSVSGSPATFYKSSSFKTEV